MSIWTVRRFVVGAALFIGISIAIEDVIWRLRGRPSFSDKPPMTLANLKTNMPWDER